MRFKDSQFVRNWFSRAIERGIPSSGNEFSYKIMDFLLTIGTWGIWSHLGCSESRVGLHAKKFVVLKWSFSFRGLITNMDEHHNPFRMRVRHPGFGFTLNPRKEHLFTG